MSSARRWRRSSPMCCYDARWWHMVPRSPSTWTRPPRRSPSNTSAGARSAPSRRSPSIASGSSATRQRRSANARAPELRAPRGRCALSEARRNIPERGGYGVISAVLFDLDGTLVETEELKAISYGRTVAELRPDVSEDEVAGVYANDLVGHSRQEVAETLVQRFGLEEAAHERMEEFGVEEPWQVLVSIRLDIYDEILGD